MNRKLDSRVYSDYPNPLKYVRKLMAKSNLEGETTVSFPTEIQMEENEWHMV